MREQTNKQYRWVMSLIRLGLVGGSTLHRDWIHHPCYQSTFSLVCEQSDFKSLLADQLASLQLVVADFSRPRDRDLDGLRRFRESMPDCRVVVLSSELDIPDMVGVLRTGIDGYLLNDISPETFSRLLLLVMSGQKVLPIAFADSLAGNYDRPHEKRLFTKTQHLTDRERQVLQCLAKGHCNKLIARRLNITEGTVKVHIKAVKKKIPAENRTQLALWARS